MSPMLSSLIDKMELREDAFSCSRMDCDGIMEKLMNLNSSEQLQHILLKDLNSHIYPSRGDIRKGGGFYRSIHLGTGL